MSEAQATSDQHEPSYYEIALTNRQVLVAFVILLVCVLGAFFSGIWVGRGGARHEVSTGLASAQVAPVAVPGQPLQELRFFTGEENGPKPLSVPANSLAADLSKPTGPAPVTATADTHAVETLSQVPQPPAELETSPPATAPIAVAPAPASIAAATVPTPSATASAKPAAAPSVTPAVPVATVAAKPVEPAAGELVVQVFSTADGEQAKKTMARVNKGGFKAYLSPLQVGKQTMYRVRIGPFTDRAQAQKIADQVRKKFRLDTWITR